jgi:hypothetical protein
MKSLKLYHKPIVVPNASTCHTTCTAAIACTAAAARDRAASQPDNVRESASAVPGSSWAGCPLCRLAEVVHEVDEERGDLNTAFIHLENAD